MTLHKTAILLLFLLLFLNNNCKRAKKNLSTSRNDTTEIIRLLFDSAFDRHLFPNENHLTTNNPFGDTIILRFDSILIGHLPKNLKIKVLTTNQISSIAKENFKDTTQIWSFLQLQDFIKLGNTYEVNFANKGIVPIFDKNGKEILQKKYPQNINFLIGYKCGDIVRMRFTKDADSLKPEVQAIWSD